MDTSRPENDRTFDHVVFGSNLNNTVMLCSTNRSAVLGRVLVVDADPGCKGLIADVLMDEGFTPLVCPSVDEAVEAIHRTQPDAVIVDPWVGSGRTPMHILDEIKADPMLRAIPIIVCSADDVLLDEHAVTLQRYRCQIIPKPFDVDTLLGAVHAVVVSADEFAQMMRVTLV